MFLSLFQLNSYLHNIYYIIFLFTQYKSHSLFHSLKENVIFVKHQDFIAWSGSCCRNSLILKEKLTCCSSVLYWSSEKQICSFCFHREGQRSATGPQLSVGVRSLILSAADWRRKWSISWKEAVKRDITESSEDRLKRYFWMEPFPTVFTWLKAQFTSWLYSGFQYHNLILLQEI